ncbi:MAG TPA: hypothetical protein VIL46_11240, partial [Gemmataceae bacterium]
VLARSPHLHRITSLYLAGRVDPLAGRVGGGTPGPLSDAAAARLLRKSSLRRLRRLDLSSNTLGARTAEALASSPATAGLEWLRLYRCGLRGAEVRTLAGSERLGALAWVDLESNEVGDEGARAIAASPHWRNVTWLDLRSNGITTAGAIALAQVDHFHPELVLLLEDNPVKQAGREALLRRFGGNVVV